MFRWYARFPILTWTGGWLLLSAGLAVRPSPPIIALLTGVHGKAHVLSFDGSRKIPARVFQAVAEGDRLELADEARVTLLCRNATIRRLDASIDLNAGLCRSGTRGSSDSEASPRSAQGGGLELHFASLELVGEARGDDRVGFDRQPVLLSPRCPSDIEERRKCSRLLDPTPAIRWLEVVGVDTYHLELTGDHPEPYKRVTVSTSELNCRELAEPLGRRVCSLPWPAERWRMVQGQRHRLDVVAVGESETVRSGKTTIRPILPLEAERLNRALETLPRMGLDAVSESLTRAAIYLGSGFVNEAVGVLASARKKAPPGLELALGNAYLQLDLPELALDSYRRALASSGNTTNIRAMAELRLGQTWMSLGDDSEALNHLLRAQQLLPQTDLTSEEEAVLKALSKALERLGETDRARELRRRAEEVVEGGGLS